MTKKRANVFEQYVDKLVLALAGVVSLGLLWMFVVSSPYAVEYSGRKLGPGRLDLTIQERAQQLQTRLDQAPVPPPPYEAKQPEVLAKIRDPLGPVIASVLVPLPGTGEKAVIEKRQYALPVLPALADVSIEAIRTVAYVPIEPLDQAIPYDKAPVQLGDVDYITVQASVDVPTIYRNFRQSFDSPMLQHPDPELAQPVFATVQLERRRLLEDGAWSPWGPVSATRNDHLARFLAVPRDPENMLDIELKMSQLRQFDNMAHVLQPDPYDFASRDEAWLAPTLHEKYASLVEREEEQKLREEREREREELQRQRETRTSGSTRPRPGTRATGRTRRPEDTMDRRNPAQGARRRTAPGAVGRGREDLEMRDQYGYGYEGRMGAPVGKQEEKSEDILADMAELMLKPDEDLSQRKEPLVIWAHDDSIEEQGTYQYRMRVGVFNPIVGKGWVVSNQAELDKQILLYTPYTEPTEPVEIKARTYFFPTNLVASVADAVEVEVARYHLGRWRTNDFTVHCGEPIGREVEMQPERTTLGGMPGRDTMMRDYRGGEYGGYEGFGNAPQGPEKVDFRTGTVLVDVLQSTTWLTAGTAMTRKELHEILYARNEGGMDRFPISNRDWPGAIRSLYDEIKKSEQQGPIQYVSRNHHRSKLQNAVRQNRMPSEMDMYRGGGREIMPGGFGGRI